MDFYFALFLLSPQSDAGDAYLIAKLFYGLEVRPTRLAVDFIFDDFPDTFFKIAHSVVCVIERKNIAVVTSGKNLKGEC